MLDLALVPHELSYFPAWMSICAFTMPYIFLEFALVNLTVGPCESSPTLFQIIKVLSLKQISSNTFELPLSLPLPLHKVSFVNTAILPFIHSLTVKFAVRETTHVRISIYQFLHSISVFYSFQHLSLEQQTLF